jgi:hypothetical protein
MLEDTYLMLVGKMEYFSKKIQEAIAECDMYLDCLEKIYAKLEEANA